MKILITIFTLFIFLGCGGSSNPVDAKDYTYTPEQGTYPAKELSLPVCEASDSRVAFIQNQDDWFKINDSSKSIFCVKPGNYQNRLVIIKNISGTKENPRYIILDNGNDEHPAKLESSQLANVDLEFENSNYWVIDRMASIGSQSLFDAPVLFRASSNNVVNRHFVDGSSGGIILRNSSHNNTIQYSRLQNMSEAGLKGDRVCIVLAPMVSVGEIKNTQILYNEIHNCNDGFQAVSRSGASMNYEGTIIYSNDISVDATLYTDCSGNKDAYGDCSYSENAIDIKAGSNNPNNKMVIKENRMWGYRKSERTDTNLGDFGTAFGMHYGTKNVIARDNIIFNSTRGIVIADKLDAKYALSDTQISGNFISGTLDYPFIVNESYNISISKNTIINSSDKSWLVLDASKNISVNDNKIVKGSSVINYGNSPKVNISEENNLFYNTITEANLGSKSFTTNKFSNRPKTILVY